MTSSISPLSYLDPSAYQSLTPLAAAGSAESSSVSGSPGQTADNSGLVQLQAMQQQGDLQAYLSNSVAAALLQPTASGGPDSATLIDNMLQQVLGAYNSSPASSA